MVYDIFPGPSHFYYGRGVATHKHAIASCLAELAPDFTTVGHTFSLASRPASSSQVLGRAIVTLRTVTYMIYEMVLFPDRRSSFLSEYD